MKRISLIFLMLNSFLIGLPWNAIAEKLIVYSTRDEHLIRPLFDKYTAETGVQISFVTGNNEELLRRLADEGEGSPADIFLTVDSGTLWQASRKGLLQAVRSEMLKKNIPESFRDPGRHWFGLSLRASVIVYNTDKVSPSELSTYKDLGHPKWQHRLVLRTSDSIYSQALVAMMQATYGTKETEDIVRRWVGNLAVPPLPKDTDVMKAILSGTGDVGIVNSYYFGRLLKNNPGLHLALFWPNQEDTGVYVDVSGAGVVRYSKQAELAVKFLEWLSSDNAQNLFADKNMEYPVNPHVEPHQDIAAWGKFKISKNNLAITGQLHQSAIEIMQRAGFQ
jgi:iron(III) transport system substrate-binding protein